MRAVCVLGMLAVCPLILSCEWVEAFGEDGMEMGRNDEQSDDGYQDVDGNSWIPTKAPTYMAIYTTYDPPSSSTI